MRRLIYEFKESLNTVDISFRYGIMQKCWSPLPKDRPTFEQLSNALRDLEHNKKPYVNLDTLLEQAIRGNDIFAHLKINSPISSH